MQQVQGQWEDLLGGRMSLNVVDTVLLFMAMIGLVGIVLWIGVYENGTDLFFNAVEASEREISLPYYHSIS